MNCKHGIPQEQWVSISKTSIGYSKYTGCLKCIKEQKKKDNIEDLKFLGEMFGMGGAIIGMIFFWVSPIMYGIQWWNILGAIICTGICCLPMYMNYRDNVVKGLR